MPEGEIGPAADTLAPRELIGDAFPTPLRAIACRGSPHATRHRPERFDAVSPWAFAPELPLARQPTRSDRSRAPVASDALPPWVRSARSAPLARLDRLDRPARSGRSVPLDRLDASAPSAQSERSDRSAPSAPSAQSDPLVRWEGSEAARLRSLRCLRRSWCHCLALPFVKAATARGRGSVLRLKGRRRPRRPVSDCADSASEGRNDSSCRRRPVGRRDRRIPASRPHRSGQSFAGWVPVGVPAV